MPLELFKSHLEDKGLSESTIKAYLYAVEIFSDTYTVDHKQLLEYKGYLIEHYKPQTTNLRINGINRYLEYLGRTDLRLKTIKFQQKTFLENVISHADYTFLKAQLKKEGKVKWYFIVWYLGATGARISELVKLKIEHIQVGYFDIYSKGGKTRRLYIPKKLKDETLLWVEKKGLRSGYLFLNQKNQQISTRGISLHLKYCAKKYGINPNVVYPHSFRHLFAKNFLKRHNDISLLADLMGHDSIETTRIYLRKSSMEQQQIINDVVTW
ncbi:tyrosine-type recombinase/integrase [Marinilactibacillus sp. Marseille-P9653]|uniref:tyrosine-type recombinase/integrase n=1 Tax=Marinilactibacillus sp. Marseille-P9653 TaxID=2866583 RepID=UPI001CE3FAB7|nr:tyrosine-type recombinase/integrase [Marinilactibacillus sp. Marseille-P9653]